MCLDMVMFGTNTTDELRIRDFTEIKEKKMVTITWPMVSRLRKPRLPQHIFRHSHVTQHAILFQDQA